ncbi:MAG: TOMM precursor leader peptide-binding protein [Hydrococcus sp. C42_A2020_068]|nr:TOMM precursor leader peptide-binding protein [Hydrococcus sp. C42_A2020_068]
MLNQPKFKSCFHVETVESVGVFLLSESEYFTLTGRLYELLAPLINGRNSIDDIVNLLREQAPAAEIYYALMLMEQKGYLVEGNEPLSLDIVAFWELLNCDSPKTANRWQTTKVSVTSFSTLPAQSLICALTAMDIQVEKEGDLDIVIVDDYLQVELEVFNQKAIQSQRPWMLVKPAGTRIWIGPIFNPDKTGCWECLAQRLRANRPVETFIQKQKGISTPLPTSFAKLPSTLQTGLNLAATEVAKWIAQGENKALEGNLITFDTLSLQIQHHALIKRPQCPVCGDLEYSKIDREPLPVILESRKKTFTTDGGHRCVTPETTIKKYEHHISPIAGAVRGLKRASQFTNSLTPIYAAGHNFATMFDNLFFLRENLRGKSGGKGKTDIQAKASALCEALERYSGIYQGDEIRRKGTYKTMGEAAIHPNHCMNFSDRQYQTRREWNNICPSFFQRVPDPFDEDREIEWTPIWSITHKEFKYLPTAYCYYGYPKPDSPYCWADSNGTAAGNTKEEAILQGFMELVERDGVALWWYNRLRQPAVDLDSFDQPYFQALKDYHRNLNRELWVLDLTSDLNIPVFAAISRRCNCPPGSSKADRDVEDIIYGFGAHFDPIIGITRALTELNQVLPAVLSVAPDGSTQYTLPDPLAMDWWQTATVQNQPYLLPDENIAPKTYADYSRWENDDLLVDVMACVDIAAQHGMEVLVLDQTRPDIGLNVVKVVVPQMRHFWKRLAPGRLYEVPVKLGKLSKPLQEEQLNPIPIFL